MKETDQPIDFRFSLISRKSATSQIVKKRKGEFEKENSDLKRKSSLCRMWGVGRRWLWPWWGSCDRIKKGPPYVCLSLKPIKGKEKINNAKSYSFDITKAEQIFDVLFKEKQIILAEGKKMPSINELKG